MTIGKHDKLIPLRDTPAVLAELTGVHRGKGTIYKWTTIGCRTVDARVVKLETVIRMKQIFTTRQAMKEFIEEVG